MTTHEQLEQLIGEPVQATVPLAPHTYLKVGGAADYFVVARTTPQLIQAVRAATELKLPWQVLGNASNVVVSDRGIRGLVVQNRTSELTFVTGTSDVLAASGVQLTRLIVEAANHDLAGLEPLFGIPATIGGGVYGNVGAHGTELVPFVRELTLYKPADDVLVRVAASWLKPTYRSTKLKQALEQHGEPVAVIVMARLTLMRRKREATLEQIRSFDHWRRNHQPVGTANCGSVFRNPPRELGQAAGTLLEQGGAKAIRSGAAHVSSQHANFVVNDGGATATDVRSVINQMRERVAAASGIELGEEIEYVGDWSPETVSLT